VGFDLDDRNLRRAGLDYHEYASVRVHASLDAALEAITPPRLFALSTRNSVRYDAVRYAEGDAFLADSLLAFRFIKDESRLARIAKARKEGALWEVERSVESAKRRYFADDVLATPGSAIVWDLVRGDADVNRTHGLIEVLTRVSEASKGEDPADLLERLRVASPEAFSFLGGIVRGV
jgi:hypothetical protein